MSWAGDVDVTATYSTVLDTTGSTAQAPVRVSGGVITQGVNKGYCVTKFTSGTSGVFNDDCLEESHPILTSDGVLCLLFASPL